MALLLLVEDDRAVSESMVALLELFGYSTIAAATIEQAVQHLRKADIIDGIIIDGRVPERTGSHAVPTVELVSEIRTAGYTGTIIAYTGEEDMLRRLIGAGCDDGVIKPGIRELLEKLKARVPVREGGRG